MKQCNECNRYNIDDNDKFCSNCGNSLSESKSCPTCGAKIWNLNKVVKCIICGKAMCDSCMTIVKKRDFSYYDNHYHKYAVCSGNCASECSRDNNY